MMKGLGAAGLAAILLACGGDGAPRGVVTTTDTVAGVVRVQHAGAAPTWRPEPLLTLGRVGAAAGEPAPDEFGRVRSVIADSAGRLYVADGMALEIRVFAPDGALLRRIGRRGSGPGETQGLHGIAWLGQDTMVVMDFGNARLMRLTTEGEEVGLWRWIRITGPVRFHFNAGPREMYAFGFFPPQDGGPGESWVRYTPEGPTDTLPVLRGDPAPGTAATCRGDGIGFFNNPFGDRFLAIPAPGRLRVVGRAAAYRLAFLDPRGDTVRVLSREIQPVPLPDSAWAPTAEAYQEFAAAWRGAECDGSITRPAHRPVLRDFYFDHAGRLLVEHTTPAGEAFDLYDADLRWLATFPAPADRDRSVPPFLRDDRLYLVTRDSLDVQRVRSFRLVPPGGEAGAGGQ